MTTPALVAIMNTPMDSKMGLPNDFTLHYLAANGMPATQIAVGPAGCLLNPWVGKFVSMTLIPFELGPGCSASNLP